MSQGYKATITKQFTFYHQVLMSSWYWFGTHWTAEPIPRPQSYADGIWRGCKSLASLYFVLADRQGVSLRLIYTEGNKDCSGFDTMTQFGSSFLLDENGWASVFARLWDPNNLCSDTESSKKVHDRVITNHLLAMFMHDFGKNTVQNPPLHHFPLFQNHLLSTQQKLNWPCI